MSDISSNATSATNSSTDALPNDKLSALPIGVFDSGVGGLTVLSALQTHLPQEDFIYLGDTARVPYGSRSAETVIRYSKRVAGHLVQRNIKILVIACNTATTYAVEVLQELCHPLGIHVFGVIEPSAQMAIDHSPTKKIAVLGTEGTIQGGKYTEKLQLFCPSVTIEQQACPLFVPIIEEGWHTHSVAKIVAEEYLQHIHLADTVILGCTHYPLLKDVLQELRPNLTFIDSAQSTALLIRDFLEKNTLRNQQNLGSTTYLVTDNLTRFTKVGYYFLGIPPHPIHLIDLDDHDERVFLEKKISSPKQ